MARSTTTDRLIGSLVGVLGFFLVVDPRVLNPTDIRWLLWGDSAQHYLGWEYFRNTPFIQWPLGANPHFGNGFGESIVYADSIPLVALPLKYLSFLLPDTFQYLGWWIFACFVLQGMFGFALLRYAEVSRMRAIAGTSMLVLFPAFLYRLTHEGYGHIALASHWIILLSMFMFVTGENRTARWMVVLTLALLVQPYLAVFPMALGVWRLITQTPKVSGQPLTSAIARIGVFISAPTIIFWIVGGFPSGGSGDSGFGLYHAALSSFIDPAPTASFGWSRVLSFLDVESPRGTNEGFAFLGAGMVLMIPVSIVISVRQRRPPTGDWHRLLVVGGLLAIFAWLPNLQVGGRTLVSVPLPDVVSDIAAIFRSNGRFVWLLAYVTAVTTFAVVATAQKRIVFLIFGLGLVLLGLIDSRSAFGETRERFSSSAEQLIGERHQSKWNSILAGRRHLVTIPPLNNDPQWIDMAYLAKQNGMTSTSAYLSRLNGSRFVTVLDEGEYALRNRLFADDSVYVIMNYPPHPLVNELLEEGNPMKADRNFTAYVIENLVVVFKG